MTNKNIVNEQINSMQAIISQRMKLMDAKDLPHIEKLKLAVSDGLIMSEEDILTKVAHAQSLAQQGTARVNRMVETGSSDMRAQLEAMPRSQVINEMTAALQDIRDWNRSRKHDSLALSEDARNSLSVVYLCLSKGEPISLTKDEIIDLTLSLTEQRCIILAAESYKNLCDTVPERFDAIPADERRELIVAIAMNLKAKGKLDPAIAAVSDDDYAAMVCAMDEVHGYCAKAAAGSLSLGTIFKAIGSLCMGLLLLIVGVGFMIDGGVAFGIISGFLVLASVLEAFHGVYTVYRSLFPAGLRETKVGKAITNAALYGVNLVDRFLQSAIRTISEISQKLFNIIQRKAIEAGGFIKTTAKNAIHATAKATSKALCHRARAIS